MQAQGEITLEQTKEIVEGFLLEAANYIVYYGKPLIAISHTNLGSNSPGND